eukprot:SM000387S14685  [mRNA]  locus=s387:48721:51545:+ [translate_table: standard]
MDPEDEALLADEPAGLKTPASAKYKERPTDKNLSWLVKTQYISSVDFEAHKQAMNEKEWKEKKAALDGQQLESQHDRASQIRSIEEAFRSARQRPVHQTQPELEPVEILPLVPNLERWGDQFLQLVFDSEPTQDSVKYEGLSPAEREKLEAQALMRSVKIPGRKDAVKDRYVGYMVPSLRSKESEAGAEGSGEEMEYDWVREYHWEVRPPDEKHHRDTYIFCFQEDKVNFAPIAGKVVLQKRLAKVGRDNRKLEDGDTEEFAVPSQVKVHKLSLTAAEEEQRLNKRQRNMEDGVGRFCNGSWEENVAQALSGTLLKALTPVQGRSVGSGDKSRQKQHESDNSDS